MEKPCGRLLRSRWMMMMMMMFSSKVVHKYLVDGSCPRLYSWFSACSFWSRWISWFVPWICLAPGKPPCLLPAYYYLFKDKKRSTFGIDNIKWILTRYYGDMRVNGVIRHVTDNVFFLFCFVFVFVFVLFLFCFCFCFVVLFFVWFCFFVLFCFCFCFCFLLQNSKLHTSNIKSQTKWCISYHCLQIRQLKLCYVI